jgi:tetratricopeptide (TPR) repeat protein
MISRAPPWPLLLLLVAPPALADPNGLRLYENGDYEAAARAFEEAMADPHLAPEERGRMHLYLAASLHALGRVEQAGRQLEILTREHPEQRLDPARFLPELVAWAEAIRQRVETEQRYAREQGEREATERAPPPLASPDLAPAAPLDPQSGPPPASPPGPRVATAHLRPELFTLFTPTGRAWLPGGGLSYVRGRMEGGARVWFGSAPVVVHLQGGVLLGSGAFQPHVGLRAVLVPGAGGYGSGAVVGGRLALPAGFVALLDVGADYFFIGDDLHQRFELTAQAGLGFDVPLP